MRRLAAVLVVVAAATAAVFLLGAGGGEGDGPPEFVIELDNAFGLTSGGDFKVAGVSAGKITRLELDRRSHRALAHVEITETGFGSLRQDVRCAILPQSLVGEYFIDCDPGNAPQAWPQERRIPVERTEGTIPPDLVGNIMRRPYRERLRLIIGELGAAVAGNGEQLNAALRRANPALRETQRVLALLADQNQVLSDLTRNADRVVSALDDNREDVGRWVVEARDAARISASEDEALAAGFRRLPTFLRELRPTMRDLGRVADAQGPALVDLARSGPQLQTFLERVQPFAEATRPALRSLAGASRLGREAVGPARATVAEAARYASGVPELGRNLAIVLEHLDDREFAVERDPRSPGGRGYTGLEALLQYTFDQTLSTNIYDSESHILKAFPFEGECAPYADRRSAEQLASHCSTALGPNAIGLNFPDLTQREPYDGDDRAPRPGPQGPVVGQPGGGFTPRRGLRPPTSPRAERREAERREAERRAARTAPGSPTGPIRLPGLEDALRPGTRPQVPAAPPVPSAPEIEPPRVDGIPELRDLQRDQARRRAGAQLLDHLLGP